MQIRSGCPNRDSGILHALLGLGDTEAVVSHPVAGASWEGFVTETLIAAAPDGATPYFYRTAAGAEIDLLLDLPGGDLWAIEVKRSLSPKVERGFHQACLDLQPARRIVVYPGVDAFPMKDGIVAMPLQAAGRALLDIR